MPREFAAGGILVPALLPAFAVAVVLYLLADWMLARSGLYRRVWHVHLFRLAVFLIIFGALGCLLYR